MKRRSGPRPLGAAFAGLEAQLRPASLLADVLAVWPVAAGEALAGRGTPVAAHQGTVTIACESAVWAQELELMGPVLVARLNAELPAALVTAVRCQSTPTRRWARGGRG